MDQQKWLLVRRNFEGTEDLADGYYRLRELDGDYQLAYLIAGPCGDKVPHPAVTLEQEGKQVRPIRLLDLEVTPILNLAAETGDSEQIEALTDRLLDRFIKMKKLVL